MATTNIDNLDGLDAVANIGAGGETAIKAAVKRLSTYDTQGRFMGLFEGQMAAEGFATPAIGTPKFVVESPTVRVKLIEQGSAGRYWIGAYLISGGAESLLAWEAPAVL